MSTQPARPADSAAISRLDRLQAELHALETALLDAQRLATIGTLAAGVAHEINNILTPVLSYAHLAATRHDDPDFFTKALAKIVSGVESACEITETMLAQARGDGDQPVADIRTSVDEALACMARRPSKDGIALHIEIDDATVVAIRPVALRQILLNLILNACTAIRCRPGRRGSIAIRATERDDGQAVLEVADDGPGIAPPLLEHLFEPFVCSPGGHGSGLGLMVTRHLVEAAGGSIEVESTPEHGATFRIVLPTARHVVAA